MTTPLYILFIVFLLVGAVALRLRLNQLTRLAQERAVAFVWLICFLISFGLIMLSIVRRFWPDQPALLAVASPAAGTLSFTGTLTLMVLTLVLFPEAWTYLTVTLEQDASDQRYLRSQLGIDPGGPPTPTRDWWMFVQTLTWFCGFGLISTGWVLMDVTRALYMGRGTFCLGLLAVVANIGMLIERRFPLLAKYLLIATFFVLIPATVIFLFLGVIEAAEPRRYGN